MLESEMSMAQRVALLSKAEQEEILKDVDPEALEYDWNFWGRPAQIPPADDSWDVGLLMGGRGSGKTRSSAEWVREKAKVPGRRFLLVARTAADVRDVIVGGESGLMNIHPPSEMPEYSPANRRVLWPNGNIGICVTADEPDGLRGVQATHSWADELAAWSTKPDGAGMTSWMNLRVATRLGDHPQIMASTTPKRVKVLYDLLEEADETGKVWVSHSKTSDNAGNMADSYMSGINGMFAGTSLAAQELDGVLLGEAEGALWTRDILDKHRVGRVPSVSSLMRFVAVDPSVAENPNDECGIVVVGSTVQRDLYKREMFVLEDASLQASPAVWAERVVRMAQKWRCPVVTEVNQGGALVRYQINQIDPAIPVYEVQSRYNKAVRAEPVTLAYEQGRVHHVGTFAELEDQMLGWMPGDRKSPDRIDALVHGLTACAIRPPKGFSGGSIVAKSPNRMQRGVGGGNRFRSSGR